jgi:hypothetical protein
MGFGWLIGLTRLRLLFIFAGLAWFAGLQIPAGARILVGILALAAVAFDGVLDDQRIRTTTQTATIPPQRTSA